MLGSSRRSTVSGPSSPVRKSTRRTNSMDKHSGVHRMMTEQLLPNPMGTRYQRSSAIVKGETDDINIRVLLLPPWPGDIAPFAKSIVDLRSRNGCVKAELNRLSGAINHFFRLSVISEESNVCVVLPSDFRGAISINQGESRRGRVRWSTDIDDRLRSGAIRMEPSQVYEDEDEVFVMAPGFVELCLVERTPADSGQTVWMSLDAPQSGVKRLKRLLSLTK